MYTCNKCGSTDVEVKCWVNANTNEIVSDCGEDSWCNNCEQYTTLEEDD